MVNTTEEIKKYMQDNGISYEEVASRIGWSRQNLWDKLNKRAKPNLESVKRIVEGLNGSFTLEDMENGAGDGDAEKVFNAVENEQIGYSVVEKILNSVGYSLKMRLHK